ncbi:hypothetical protein [Virgibacillus ndiopensis]|uniref:hypothetical protein n=1 Tax=Virgibacillus ndiopensis TaxID=2004408 RepID=UPI000C0696C4|nr:hypothetical protein [Virgibacillus ndiopensis]
MDLLVIVVVVLAFIFTLFMLNYAKSSLQQAKKGSQQINEMNAIRKGMLEVQRETLNELREIRKRLDSKS